MEKCMAVALFLLPLAIAAPFEEIRKSPAFVDKTDFIPLCLSGDTRPLVISAPSGFGKTSSLLMLEHFFNEVSDSTRERGLFKATRISENPEKMQPHENMTVLYCSLKHGRRLTDYESVLEGFREVLFRTFKAHSYLVKSRKLNRYDKKVMTVYAGVKKHLRMTHTQITLGLFYLSKLLHKHHERPILVVVDDYDNIILDSLFTKGLDGPATLALHRVFFSAVLRKNPHVSRAILAGETSVCAKPLVSDLDLTFSDNRFSSYLGLTESDLDDLLKRENYKKFVGKGDTIRRWYGGYMGHSTKHHLYHFQAALSYLTSGDLRSYWTETRESRALRILMIEPAVEQLLNDSISYATLQFNHVDNVRDRHLQGIKSISTFELWDEEFADIFMTMLLETGYYTKIDQQFQGDHTVKVRIPNEQIRTVLDQVCTSFLEDPMDLLDRLKEAVHEAAFLDKSEKPPPAAEEVEALISTIIKPGVKKKNLMRL